VAAAINPVAWQYKVMSRTLIAAGLLPALMLPATVVAQESCTPIRFAPGHSSATVKGTAPPEDSVCYSFAAADGQTAHLKVTGRNMIISVINVGDARDSWTFRTKAQTYRFIVAQLLRSVSSEPYAVTLSVK
jgi:hypothetical protein